MAEKAIMLLKDPKMLHEFKRNAKIQALKFDEKNIIPMYENLYLSVLEKEKQF